MNAAARCRVVRRYAAVWGLAPAALVGCCPNWATLRLESAGVAVELPGKVKCSDGHRETSDGRWDGIWCAADTDGPISLLNPVFSVHALVVRRFPASLVGQDLDHLIRASEAPSVESKSALLADLEHRRPAREAEQTEVKDRRPRTLGGVAGVERTISFPDSRGSFVSKELYCVHEQQLIVLKIFGLADGRTEREWDHMVDSFAFMPRSRQPL